MYVKIEIDEIVENSIENVNKRFEDIINAIKKNKEELLKQISEIHSQKTKNIETYQEKSKNLLERCKKHKKRISELVLSPIKFEKLNERSEKITNELDKIFDENIPYTEINDKLKVKEETKNLVDNVTQNLQKIKESFNFGNKSFEFAINDKIEVWDNKLKKYKYAEVIGVKKGVGIRIHWIGYKARWDMNIAEIEFNNMIRGKSTW